MLTDIIIPYFSFSVNSFFRIFLIFLKRSNLFTNDADCVIINSVKIRRGGNAYSGIGRDVYRNNTRSF